MIFESEMVMGWMIMAIMLLWRWPKIGKVDDQMISKLIFLGHSILRQCQLMVSHIIDMYRYVYV